MKLDFEYGHGLMSADLPDSTDVFIPGETVPDPPCLPQDMESLMKATRTSVRNPIGMPPLSELAHKGSKVTIVIPDIVKGGCQPTAHRKVSIKVILEELYAAGVEKKDILLIFSNGLHPRATVPEARQILGEELFRQFYHTGQITSHDSEDYEHLVDLGCTERGDRVIMNKYVYDSDVAILIGHTQGNPYGGYSGGYKHCSTGITHWRSIATHHVPDVMHRQDFTPVSGHSLMRTKFDEIGMHMEKCMGKKFFCCDAVLDTYSRQIAVYSGYAKEMMPVSWEIADKRTYVPWAEKKYDVMVFGMPQSFHYGDGTRVAYGKTFSYTTVDIHFTTCGAIKQSIAGNCILVSFEIAADRGKHGDTSATQTLAKIIVRFPFQFKVDPWHKECTERLTCRTFEFHIQRMFW